MNDTSWREIITDVMARYGETLQDAISMAFESVPNLGRLTEGEADGKDWLDIPVDPGYASGDTTAFCIWTAARVYFPSVYDGEVGCASVSRNPDGKVVFQVGGG